MSIPSPETAEHSVSSPDVVRRLTDRVVEKFGTAFQRASTACGDESLTWEIYPAATPNPMQPGQILTGLMIFMSIPAGSLGEHITVTMAVEGHMIDADQHVLDEFAFERLSELTTVRTQHLTRVQQAAAEEQAGGNGHRPPTSGLILPGH